MYDLFFPEHTSRADCSVQIIIIIIIIIIYYLSAKINEVKKTMIMKTEVEE